MDIANAFANSFFLFNERTKKRQKVAVDFLPYLVVEVEVRLKSAFIEGGRTKSVSLGMAAKYKQL